MSRRESSFPAAARASGVTSILSWHSFVPGYTEIDFYDRLLDMSETEATREGYFRMHKASIHPQRYAAFAQSLRTDERPKDE